MATNKNSNFDLRVKRVNITWQNRVLSVKLLTFSDLNASGLAQSVKRLPAEREVQGFDLRGRTNI